MGVNWYPCVHAFRCILDKRADPNDYVHEAYSRATYLLTYGATIKSMPGVKHWEKVDLPRPLSPITKTMPGRPKSKKRKKDKGEDAEKHP
ncbi:putative serine/threonine-protein kinase MEC1-like protein [Bienertia sinuspersici]